MKRFLLTLSIFSSLTAISFAALPSNQPAVNLIPNGNFNETSPLTTLWDGVDSDGFLAGGTATTIGVVKDGYGKLPAPLSVNFVDLNDDGLPDLITADPRGYVRVYFNTGTKTAPRFTHAEMLPIFLSPSKTNRGAPKISMVDWNGDGKLYMIFGNYKGEVLFIPNIGTKKAPEFRQPDFERAVIQTSSSGHLWGNNFAPLAMDWNHDGKMDLLLGEGSYSANSIHLLLNHSAGSAISFNDEDRHYLAYGNGREELVPAAADFDGNGHEDLIVGDRKGTLSLYKNPGGWKPGTVLKYSSQIKLGNTKSFGSCIAPYAADFNGDGLIDLIIGESNGRIALSLNKGTKSDPKFSTPVELGANYGAKKAYRETGRVPNHWDISDGGERGNMYVVTTCVDAAQDKSAQPTPGTKALRINYNPSLNKFFKSTPFVYPGDPAEESAHSYLFATVSGVEGRTVTVGVGNMAAYAPSDEIIMRCSLSGDHAPLPGTDYVLSFKVKGRGFTEGQWTFAYVGFGQLTEAKIERGQRGNRKVKRNIVTEQVKQIGNFSPASSWTTVSKPIRFQFTKEVSLNNPDTFKGVGKPYYIGILQLRFKLPPYASIFYLDDVKLVKKKGF